MPIIRNIRCWVATYGFLHRVFGARHHPYRTHDLHSGSQVHHPSKNSVQKTICCNSTSNAPNDGHRYPKHVVFTVRMVPCTIRTVNTTWNKNISYLTLCPKDPTSAEALIILKEVFSTPCSQSPYRMISAVLSKLSPTQDFFLLYMASEILLHRW